MIARVPHNKSLQTDASSCHAFSRCTEQKAPVKALATRQQPRQAPVASELGRQAAKKERYDASVLDFV